MYIERIKTSGYSKSLFLFGSSLFVLIVGPTLEIYGKT